MERVEIFKQLLETEKTARIISDEATLRQEGLGQYLEETVESLRRDTYARADEEIARAEESAVREADRAIALQDENLARHMEQVRRAFDLSRDEWADHLFDIAIHR